MPFLGFREAWREELLIPLTFPGEVESEVISRPQEILSDLILVRHLPIRQKGEKA